MTRPGPAVPFHDAPSGNTSKYADVIARAKANQVPDRPGDMKNTPSFEDTQRSWESKKPQKTQLSPKTTAGLSAIVQNNPTAETAPAPEEEPDVRNVEDTNASEDSLDESERIRRSVEARISEKIDIGQYLVNGEVSQIVPIIPSKLEITFRSVTDLEEAFVDAQLSKNKDISARSFVRMSNEWALAFHIVAVNGNRWPPTVVDGKVNEVALEKRLAHVRKLSSPVFQLITQNLVWFLERVTKGLTMEVLGNG
jgi:hypothetical protein